MEKRNIAKFRLDPKDPPKTDWRAFDARSEEESHQAALSDPDCPPATEEQLARARRMPTVKASRLRLSLTQEEFAAKFHLPLGTIKDWEEGAHRPDEAGEVLLKVIAKDPKLWFARSKPNSKTTDLDASRYGGIKATDMGRCPVLRSKVITPESDPP
jgi:putative transcriptional regulator